MKLIIPLFTIALLSAPTAAIAQGSEESPFNGVHFGLEANRSSNEVRQPAAPDTASPNDRNGFGGRAFVGYGVSIGDIAVIGVEAGIGKGGRAVKQNSVAGGRYETNPRLTYDATARIGFTPVSNLLVYAKGGYRWLQTTRTISGQAVGNTSTKLTEKGMTYGGGIEFAVSKNFALRAEYDRTKFDRDFKQSKISVGALVRF